MGWFDIFKPETEAEFRARVGYGAANEPFFATQAEATAWRVAQVGHVPTGTLSGGVLGSVGYAALGAIGVPAAEARAITQAVTGLFAAPVGAAGVPAAPVAPAAIATAPVPARPVLGVGAAVARPSLAAAAPQYTYPQYAGGALPPMPVFWWSFGL